MATDLNIGSKIKVTDKTSKYFRYRGIISADVRSEPTEERPNGEVLEFICTLHNNVENGVKVNLKPDQIECIQKKFIDIEHIKEGDVDLGNGVVRRANTYAFEPGDIIQITEKIDGANASIAWNEDEGHLEIFSRTNLLDGADGLRGFKAYIETKFKPDEFRNYPDYVIFGEWCVSHHCKYEHSWYNVWRVYDIWDKRAKNYLPQFMVETFCAAHNIEYIHELYNGPFISWEHCRSFMNKKTYGGIEQEGIVVKNQTKLNRDDVRFPKYLKIVNDTFKETMAVKAKEAKIKSPEEIAEEKAAFDVISAIVTEARIRKILLKLVDEGTLSSEFKPSDMGIVCKNVPKMVWEDILHEENEIVKSVGALAGKVCNQITINICRKIIIGK